MRRADGVTELTIADLYADYCRQISAVTSRLRNVRGRGTGEMTKRVAQLEAARCDLVYAAGLMRKYTKKEDGK